METDKEIGIFLLRIIKNLLNGQTTKEVGLFLISIFLLVLVLIVFKILEKYNKFKLFEAEKKEYTNLMKFVAADDVRSIEFELLKKSSDIESSLNNGQNALMIAAKLNKINSLICLIQFNANIRKKDNDGNTAYDLAVNYGNIIASQILKDAMKKLESVN